MLFQPPLIVVMTPLTPFFKESVIPSSKTFFVRNQIEPSSSLSFFSKKVLYFFFTSFSGLLTGWLRWLG
jgi:hypothetical protein